MNPEGKRYVVGIDLGTTNSAVSYADLNTDAMQKEIRIFRVPQLTGPGEFSRMSVLPSFLYVPGEYDISKSSITIPWKTDSDSFVGAFARDHGAKVPSRLVSSAKSWLCHDNVDRHAKILPWGSGDEIYKVSPVEATAAYLKHIRAAWNAGKGDDEDQYLENQAVVITVPASFDEVARDLTLEAAAMAGLRDVLMLEEPLAAFYSWLIRHEKNWSESVATDELILVCDVGGGTTDFTLISLQEVEGSPRFERIAVGDHLILGGDNIDFALARLVESRSAKGAAALNQDRWKNLCHQCRNVKETIFAGGTDACKITLMGEGSRLIAGTISAEITRADLERTVVEGFFPLADSKAIQEPIVRKGITELGLPFEQEPAITRHLGWFLERHREEIAGKTGRSPMPDLILFNGGSLKPALVQNRIREAIRHWFGNQDPDLPRVLENPEPDLAVALGASYYGLVKLGRGVRVGSGSPRGYYLGISPANGEEKQAVCLVERGLDEGSHIELSGKKFEVLANQPACFELYSSSYRSGDRTGDIVGVDRTLTPLPPVQTVIQFGQKGVQASIPVRIEADYTEIGSLAVWCRSMSSSHRWRLQFQLRASESSAAVADAEVYEESIVADACAFIRSAFSNSADAGGLEDLPKTLSAIVERSKEDWPLSFIRRLADVLLEEKKSRRISAAHESRWLNLAGFCMRPGFGESLDQQRVKALWKIYNQGLLNPKQAQAASEWWILWRRIAGGLTAGQQRQFSQDLQAVIMPRKGSAPKIPPQQKLEMWMTIANMERLVVKDKIKWGRKLLMELKPKKTKPQFFLALSRIGARELLYGSADRVIPAAEVAQWIEKILSQTWRNPKPVGAALIHMARKTGDRARDLSPETINSVLDWLAQYDVFDNQFDCLQTVIPIARQEEATLFGESLPSGIVLHD